MISTRWDPTLRIGKTSRILELLRIYAPISALRSLFALATTRRAPGLEGCSELSSWNFLRKAAGRSFWVWYNYPHYMLLQYFCLVLYSIIIHYIYIYLPLFKIVKKSNSIFSTYIRIDFLIAKYVNPRAWGHYDSSCVGLKYLLKVRYILVQSGRPSWLIDSCWKIMMGMQVGEESIFCHFGNPTQSSIV